MPDNLTPNKITKFDLDQSAKSTAKDDPNQIKITAGGEEGTYSKWGLIMAVVIIFFLGFVAGAITIFLVR